MLDDWAQVEGKHLGSQGRRPKDGLGTINGLSIFKVLLGLDQSM